MVGEDLRGKTALITGAGRRLGRAIALALAAEGVNIMVHYPDPDEEVNDLGQEITGMGVKSWSVKADFEKPDEYSTLIERSLEDTGSLDILINNAAIFLPDTLKKVDFDSLTKHMQINTWVPLVLSRHFAEKVSQGSIINMLDSRISGYDWSHVAYILSKHALAVLTRMTALEFAPDITVNGVAPGLILPPPGRDEAYLDLLKDSLPLKKHGQAADISETVIYLIRADFVTGQIIYVDGGRHLKEESNG
ncbi:MAG: SDR family oxidoreductase [bacterium]